MFIYGLRKRSPPARRGQCAGSLYDYSGEGLKGSPGRRELRERPESTSSGEEATVVL